MEKDEVIQADFVGYKQMKRSGVIRLELDVPELMATAVFERLGIPKSGESLWCVIAKIPSENQ
jgi:hypothetical protein